MTKRLYDEIPFSKDYNYDKLTNSEANEVLLSIKRKRRHDYKFIVRIVLRYTLLLIISSLIIYVTIFVLDWHEIRELFSASPNSWVIYQKIFSVFLHILMVSFCVKEIIFWVKHIKVNSKFLIAKGYIIDVQKDNVKPDAFHPNGVKASLTVAVSDSEKLPPFDISLHPYDSVVIGDSIIIIYFPKYPMRMCIYLYRHWSDMENK